VGSSIRKGLCISLQAFGTQNLVSGSLVIENSVGEIVPSINSPIEYLEVNIQGTAKLLEACRTAQVQSFVYAASSFA
jgi:UDP-glucose 4-epimerase